MRIKCLAQGHHCRCQKIQTSDLLVESPCSYPMSHDSIVIEAIITGAIEYRSDDVTKNFFCISAFWIPCLGGAWWKTSSAQIWWESVHGGSRYGGMNTYLAPFKSVYLAWFQTVMSQAKFTLISMGLIRYSCGNILGHHEPIHVQIWCVKVFHHALPKYGHENAEMQTIFFDDVTLRYSIVTTCRSNVVQLI